MSVSRTRALEAFRESRFGAADGVSDTSSRVTLAAGDGGAVVVPDAALLRDGAFLRQGGDLVIRGADGAEVVVQGYFAARPTLTTADGAAALSPGLVDSFLSAMAPGQYAQSAGPVASPIGQVDELTGDAFAVRADGTRVQLAKGDPVFEGDIVETGGGAGAIRMVFVDKTMFALGSDARLALDKLVFDPSHQSGSSQFSILKGVFIFSSGEIAKTDNTEMSVITPVAAIGIRGTEVAGRVDGANSQFTIIDGAIEVTTQAGSVTQDKPGETTLVSGIDAPPSELFVLSAAEYGVTYGGVASVAPRYFSTGDRAIGKDRGDGVDPGQGGSEGRDDAPKGENAASADKQPASNSTREAAGNDGPGVDSDLPVGGDTFTQTLLGSAAFAQGQGSDVIGVVPSVAPGISAGSGPSDPSDSGAAGNSNNSGGGMVPSGSGGAGGSVGKFEFTLDSPSNSYAFSSVGPTSKTTLIGNATVKYVATDTGAFDFEVSGALPSVEDMAASITISNFEHAEFKLENGAGSKIAVDSADIVRAETGAGDDRLIFNGLEADLSELTFKGGLGIDTLQLSGPGQTFDLSAKTYDLTEVEHIDLSSGADALVKLGANILSNLNGSGLNDLSGTDDTLVISGDAGDAVEFMNGASWGQAAMPHTINGESYSVFAHASGSQVMVHEDVATIV